MISRKRTELRPEDWRRLEPAALARLQAEIDAGLAQARDLIAQGRERDALRVCRRLDEKAPGHGEVLAVLGLLYARTGEPAKGLQVLTEALGRGTRNPRALYNLAQVYLLAGAPVHALHSLRSYRAEVAAIPFVTNLPVADDLIATLATFMREEPGVAALAPDVQDRAMMAAERGRLRLLFSDDPEKALPELRDAVRLAPAYPQPRNNLSLAHFYNGQTEQALAILEATLREISAGNVYALATRAFVRWAAGGVPEESRAQVARAAALLQPRSRLLDRTRVAEVGGALGDHALAYDVLAAESAGQDVDGLDGAHLEATRVRLLATAAANLGRTEEAEELLRASPGLAVDAGAARFLAALGAGEPLPGIAGGGYPYLAWDDLLSAPVLRRLVTPAASPRLGRRPPSAPAPEQVVPRLVALYPRLPLACALLIWRGEPVLENLALILLSLAGTPEADALLDVHLRGTLGSYAGRQRAGYALLDAGRLPNGAGVPFWSGTAWTEIRLFRLSPQRRDLPKLIAELQSLLPRLAPRSDA